MSFTGASQSYVLAQTMDERVAVMMVKFYQLWNESPMSGTLPDVETCRKFIKSSVWTEALVCAHGYLHQMKNEVTIRVDQKLAHDIMVNRADVEKKLLLEHL